MKKIRKILCLEKKMFEKGIFSLNPNSPSLPYIQYVFLGFVKFFNETKSGKKTII